MVAEKCNNNAIAGTVVLSLMLAVGVGYGMYVATTTNPTATTTTTTTATTTTSPNCYSECGVCGPEINVTLRVENNIIGDNFNESTLLTNRTRELIFFLQAAADTNKAFLFTGKYYANLGYFIETINGLTPTNNSYWQITNGTYSPLSLGVSSYIPENNELIIFRVVTWTPSDHS